MAQLKRMLVPTDFSESADVALAYAKALAASLGASLHLLHVFTNRYTPAGYVPEVYGRMPTETREGALEDARVRLEERLDADEQMYFRGTRDIVTGLAAKQIVKYAADHGVALIVMGTHGRRGIAHLLLGSVAEHVVRTARCPVLTVGATDERSKAITAGQVA